MGKFHDEIALGPINNDKQYQEALNRAKEYYRAEPGTDEYDRFEVLMGKISRYEEQYGIEPPDDKLHKYIRIAGRLATIKRSHCPPPWKVVQLQPFGADTFLAGDGKRGLTIGAEIKWLAGPASEALAKMPEDVEWLLKQLLND